MPYKDIFNKIVASLKDLPQIHINHFVILDPDVNEIVEVEEELGYSLDKNIKDFYSTFGGIQLIWTHKANRDYEELKKINNKNRPFKFDWRYLNYHNFDGVIMIPSIIDVFFSEWFGRIYFDFTIEDKETVVFAGKEYIEPDFSERIKPFDWFSKYNDMAFFLDGTANPKLILGD